MGSGHVTCPPWAAGAPLNGSAHPPHRGTGALFKLTRPPSLPIMDWRQRHSNLKSSWRHKVLKASWEMPVIVMFSARVERRHLENSCIGAVMGVVGPSEWVGRVQSLHPTSLAVLPILNPGASSVDLIGTKWKPFIWSNVPTLYVGKPRPQEVKGYVCQHYSG